MRTHPTVDMQRPRCRETRERNRAGHTFLLQAWETCARAPSKSVIPAKAGISGGKGTTLPSPQPVIPAQAGIHKPVRVGQEPDSSGNMDSRLRGNDEGKVSPRPPSCRTLRQAQDRLVPASTERSPPSRWVDPGQHRGDGAKTVTANPPPSCQRKLASISYP